MPDVLSTIPSVALRAARAHLDTLTGCVGEVIDLSLRLDGGEAVPDLASRLARLSERSHGATSSLLRLYLLTGSHHSLLRLVQQVARVWWDTVLPPLARAAESGRLNTSVRWPIAVRTVRGRLAQARAEVERLLPTAAQAEAVPARAPPESAPGHAPEADGPDRVAPPYSMTKIDLARAIKMRHPDWGLRQVAQEVPCSHAHLSRSPEYQEWAAQVERAHRGDPVAADRFRGHDLDAYAG